MLSAFRISSDVFGGVCLAITVALLAACGQPQIRDLEAIRERGEMVVLTTESPTTYAAADATPEGYEYDLTQALGHALGVTVRYRIFEDLPELIDAIASGEGDIAAAGITRTDARAERAPFGPAYRSVRQQVVCRRGADAPNQLNELADFDITVVSGSSYVEALESLDDEIVNIGWRTAPSGSAAPLLESVQNGEIDCTVADSNLVAVTRRKHPELIVPFDLTEDQALAWMTAPGADNLLGFLEEWFEIIHSNGLLAKLDERYYGHLGAFDYVDVARFRRSIGELLPTYRPIFESAAAANDLPWDLLAAQSYQESHWDPHAKSPTGVRGMMMLTLPTARSVGVSNRLDPEASIIGGSKHLRRMIDRLPDDIEEHDRLWMALAAYNMGMGHLQDARILAERLDRDPDAWHDLEEMLPLLSRKIHYASLPHGYARGAEAAQYVRRVREYRSILQEHVAIPALAAD